MLPTALRCSRSLACILQVGKYRSPLRRWSRLLRTVYRPLDDRVARMLLDPRPAGRGILLQQHLGLHKGRETVVVVGFGILRVVMLLRLHGCRCLEEGSRHLSTLLIFHCSCGPLLLNHTRTRNRRRILRTLHSSVWARIRIRPKRSSVRNHTMEITPDYWA